MFSGKMHLLVDLLDACHVGLRIIRKLNFISAAHTLGSPVEISEIYRASHFAGNGMESCLPTLYRLAGAFRSKREVYAWFLFHLLDYAQEHCGGVFPVNRNAAELSEQPAERAFEEFALYNAVRLSAY